MKLIPALRSLPCLAVIAPLTLMTSLAHAQMTDEGTGAGPQSGAVDVNDAAGWTPASASEWAATATKAHMWHGATQSTQATELAPDAAVHVAVSLKLRNKADLDALVTSIMRGESNAYLTSAQFNSMHGPTAEQVGRVVAHLQGAGFKNIAASPSGLLISADGTAATVKTAFHTRLLGFVKDGRQVYVNADDAQVPSSIADIVLAVHGLQTADMAKPMAIKKTNMAMAASGQFGHDMSEFQQIYNAASLPAATNTTIGIISDGPLTNPLANLSAFATAEHYAQPSVSTQFVAGSAGSDTSADLEWSLDSQASLAAAGGAVQQLVFYAASNLQDSSLAEAYSAAVSQNVAKIINVSLGECENIANSDGTMSTDDQFFEQAISQGQVFSVASGDKGADGCLNGLTYMQIPSYPGTSPYVLSVGGTTLTTDTTGTVWQNEVVWSDPVEVEATGGGQSGYEAAAVFQTGYGILASGQMRGYPDIAFDGDPNTGALVTGYSGEMVGGTSLAAPLFTGFWARLQSAHRNSLPFPASAIYSTAVNTSAYAADFHDVTQGCNQAGPTSPCFEATTGWDKASGFGSISVAAFSGSLTGSTGGDIFRLYEGILARVPDPAGEAFQIQAFEQGASLTTIASGMLASSEFASKFGSATQTNTGFVTQMYVNALHRQPASSEVQYYLNLLTSGTSRGTVAVYICESPEAINDWAAYD